MARTRGGRRRTPTCLVRSLHPSRYVPCCTRLKLLPKPAETETDAKPPTTANRTTSPDPAMSMPGGEADHWSQQFSSHDDLCALNGLTVTNDEVLSSLFSRRGAQPSSEHSVFRDLTPPRHRDLTPPQAEGARDSARKDFVQGLLPDDRSRSAQPLRPSATLLPRSSVSVAGLRRSSVSVAETSSSSRSAERKPSDDPIPSAHRSGRRPSSSSYTSTMPARQASSEVNLAKARSTETPSTLEACGAEIARLRALLDAERVAVQVLSPPRPWSGLNQPNRVLTIARALTLTSPARAYSARGV